MEGSHSVDNAGPSVEDDVPAGEGSRIEALDGMESEKECQTGDNDLVSTSGSLAKDLVSPADSPHSGTDCTQPSSLVNIVPAAPGQNQLTSDKSPERHSSNVSSNMPGINSTALSFPNLSSIVNTKVAPTSKTDQQIKAGTGAGNTLMSHQLSPPKQGSVSGKQQKNTNHDPDEANVITIEPLAMDSDGDDDRSTVNDPEVADAELLPPVTSYPLLVKQEEVSCCPSLKNEAADSTGPDTTLPASVAAGVTVSNQRGTPVADVHSVELKSKGTIFGLMMVMITQDGTTRKFFCNFCLTKSTDEKIFMDHVATHLFVCGGCSFQSFARVDIVHHILKFHPESENDLAKLHTMHLKNAPLKPLGLTFKVGSGKNAGGSNVLSGTNITNATCTRGTQMPPHNPKPVTSGKTIAKTSAPLAIPPVVKQVPEERPNLLNRKKPDSTRMGFTVLEKPGGTTEEMFYVKIPGNPSERIKLMNGQSPKVVMYQCDKCQFRDQDDQVVRVHQKAHMLEKLTVILSAYGVVCPYCLSIHKTMPFIYQHLELMHKRKPLTFFIMIRCVGSKDMYWFCPCCNVVKSDKQRQVIWKHVMEGHQIDYKFSKLYMQFRHNDAPEKFLISLWVNAFVLKRATTCTAVVPRKENVINLKGKGDADLGKGPKEETTDEEREDDCSGDEATPMDTEQIPEGLGYVVPAKLTKKDLSRRNLPTPAWLRANFPGATLRQEVSKKDQVLTICAAHVPPDSVPFNYKDYCELNEGIRECKLCGKPFTGVQSKRPVNQEDHIYCHVNISIWVCPFCKVRHKRRADVLTHIRTDHPNLPLVVIRDAAYVSKSTQVRGLKGAPVRFNALPVPTEALQSHCPNVFVYSCFFCPRQTQTSNDMLDHVKYVHPDKPYSSTMYQKIPSSKPDHVGEREKIAKGLLKAAVSVVKVEDMEEYEHQSTCRLREGKVKLEEDVFEELTSPWKRKKLSKGTQLVRSVSLPRKTSRSVARKSTAKLQRSAIAAASAVTPGDSPGLMCSLCLVIEKDVTFMKQHYKEIHPACAIVAVNASTKTCVYICPQSSCLYHEEDPSSVENHLILSHDGDKDDQKAWYSPAEIASQHGACGASWPTDDIGMGDKKLSTVEKESSDTDKLHSQEDCMEEDSRYTSACNAKSGGAEVPLTPDDLTSESSSDDRDSDPDFTI